MPFSPARPLAVPTAAFVAAAIAGISLSGAQAAPPQRPPVQRAAPPRVVPPRPAPQVRFNRPPPPQVRFSRPPAPTVTQRRSANQNVHAVKPGLPRVNPDARFNSPNFQHANPNLPKVNPNLAHPTGLPVQGALKLGPGKPNFSPANLKQGPGGLQQIKPAFPAVSMHNKFWPIQKGPKFMWIGDHRRFFVPVGLLGVALIGGSYWYPDGYVSIAGPACYGFTPDGCQLQWRLVDFEDGGAEPQCVQYCPQAGPPPAAAAPLPPPPALAQGGTCEVTIFSDPNFAGLSAPTSDNQPVLSQTGWQNEISSIQIQSGTWDFFSAENFGGESMRLAAGQYPALAPEWTKRIGSFMCVQPGAPGA